MRMTVHGVGPRETPGYSSSHYDLIYVQLDKYRETFFGMVRVRFVTSLIT